VRGSTCHGRNAKSKLGQKQSRLQPSEYGTDQQVDRVEITKRRRCSDDVAMDFEDRFLLTDHIGGRLRASKHCLKRPGPTITGGDRSGETHLGVWNEFFKILNPTMCQILSMENDRAHPVPHQLRSLSTAIRDTDRSLSLLKLGNATIGGLVRTECGD